MKELKNILLAEDEFDIQRIIKIALERIGGFNVTIVNSGKEAVTVLDSFIPDLLVSDIMMPEMNGIELAKYILSKENLKNIPIVFMTAKSQIQEIEAYKSAFTSCDVITKPFDPMMLSQRINSFWVNQTEL